MIPGILLCGAYPGRDYDPRTRTWSCSELVKYGIDTFVSLTKEKEQAYKQLVVRLNQDRWGKNPSGGSGSGGGSASGGSGGESTLNPEFLHYPIPDQFPADDHTKFRSFLDGIVTLIKKKGRKVYM